MLRLIDTYVFNVMGDGVTKEMLIPMRGFKAPDPLQPNIIPSGFYDVQIGNNPGGATFALEGEFLHVTFNVPPASNIQTKVTITALFGTTRI
jgi:hypothetical protein